MMQKQTNYSEILQGLISQSKIECVNESGLYLYLLCPFHNDTQASLCINKIEHNNKPKGYYFCYGCGKTGKISEFEVDYLAKKAAYCPKSANTADLFKQTVENLSGVLAEDYPGDLIYNGSSEEYMIGWDGLRWTAPMWGNGRDRTIIGIQTRTRNGIKWNIPGSKLGLFLPKHDLNITSTIYVCEGLTDTLVAAYCTDMTSIGLPSANSGHKLVKNYLESIGFKGKVAIVADDDEAGIRSTRKLCEVIPHIAGRIIFTTPFNDLWDYFRSEGYDKTERLLH